MVDSLSKSTIHVHQALHGYSDGHRQLALSATLKGRDQRTLLALSDTSGPSARMDRTGYLTGYPLADSGFYALARTWSAPEMPRPGCVWTHTLLIDFTELAGLENLTNLAGLFVRPEGPKDFQLYSRPKVFVDDEPSAIEVDADWARTTLSALYGRPESRIIATPKNGADLDVTVLAIWSQQWPRLRRGFRFCTLSAGDRSSEGASFDLQILPKLDRSIKGQFAGAVDAEKFPSMVEPWLNSALDDLQKPDAQGLRSFLKSLGSDIALGREAFRPLCRLFEIIDQPSAEPFNVQIAVDILQNELNPKEAKAARRVVANAALSMIDGLDAPSFDFLLASLDLFDRATLEMSASRIGQAIWRRDPRNLLEFTHSDGIIFVEGAIVNLPLDELITGLQAVDELTSRALELRPELITTPAFWSTITNPEMGMITAIRTDEQERCVASMLDAHRSDLAGSAVRAFGQRAIFEALDRIVTEGRPDFNMWLKVASNDLNGIGEYLASDTPISKKMLVALARILLPDAIRNDYGSDPWCNAWERSVGHLDDADEQYFSSFLFVRALGYQSKSQAQLVQIAFDKIYAAAEAGRLIDDAWHMLDSKLPKALFWVEWDRCQRLRSGVVDLFVDRDLSPGIFGRLTQSEKLFVLLVEAATGKWRGRDYLRRVRKAIKDYDHLSGRADYLKKLLG